MRRVCTYPIVFFMAALIFYGGAGMNVAFFCCNDCQSAGIEGIIEGVCCGVHHHEHDEMNSKESGMDYAGHSHEMCCFLSRIAYDWNTSRTSMSNPEPDSYNLSAMQLPDVLTVSSPFVKDKTYESSSGPPFLSPQAYLSLLNTLLI